MVTPATLYQRLPAMRQRSRRIAVIAAFSGVPLQNLGYGLLVEPGRLPAAIWGAVSVVLYGATLIGLVAIYGYGRDRMDRARQELDERQRAMVDRSLIVSYGLLTIVIVGIAGIVALVASFAGPIVLGMSTLTPWFLAIGLYVPFLPFAALAWIEPDAPADDEG